MNSASRAASYRRPQHESALRRPVLPPLFICMICLWVSIAFVLYIRIYLSMSVSLLAAAVSGIFALTGVLVLSRSHSSHKGMFIAVTLGLWLGFTLGAVSIQKTMDKLSQIQQACEYIDHYTIEGIVESDVHESAFGSNCVLKVLRVTSAHQQDSTEVFDNGSSCENLRTPPETWELLKNTLITIQQNKSYSAPQESFSSAQSDGHVASNLSGDPHLVRDICAYGNVVSVTGKLTVCDPGNSYDQRKITDGVIAQLKIEEISSVSESSTGIIGIIKQIRNQALTSIDPHRSPTRSLIAGLCVGYKETLQQMGIRTTFSQTGLSHMIAVSGTHLALVLMFVERISKIVHLGRFQRIAVLIGTCMIFVVFTGVQISALRSLLMSMATLLAPLFKRRAHSLSGLSAAGCIILCSQPQAALNVSFALSVSSVASIIIFNPLIERVLSRGVLIQNPIALSIRSAISMSLCAQLATTWLTIPLFGMFSAVSPLANACVTPLMSALLLIGLLVIMGTLVMHSLGSTFTGLYDLLDYPTRLCLSIVNTFAELPGAWFSVSLPLVITAGISIIVLGVLWASYQKVRYLSVRTMAVVCFALTTASVGISVIQTPDGVYALDVGQGDAILIRSHGRIVLVDTGDNDALIKPLARNHINHIDMLVLTHLDRDHVGGIPALEHACTVDYVVVASGVSQHLNASYIRAFESMDVKQIVEVQQGDTLSVGSITSKVLWPPHQVTGDNNEDSVCLLTTLDQWGTGGDFSVLLTGDLESEELQHVINDGLEHQEVTVLKVGHHGARVSLNDAQAKVLKSRWALISCGKKNRYGHPSPQCLRALGDVPSEVLRTDIMGDCGVISYPWGLRSYRQKDR